jgi:tetratricopeptide (TPR) repeat protein
MDKQRSNSAERAEDLYRRGAFRSAALALRASLVQTPSSYRLMVMFARALEKVNPHSPFRHYARKATHLAPGRADAWLVYARGLFNQREIGKAANTARRYLILEPGALDGVLMLSRSRFQRGEYEQCLKNLNRAAALAPEDKLVHMARARCLFRQGQNSQALDASQSALKHGAELADFGFDHCRIARAAGRHDIAAPVLAKLAELDRTIERKSQILNFTVAVDDLRARSS